MLHMDSDWREVNAATTFAGINGVVVCKVRAELVMQQVLVTRGIRELLGR